jgi:hypothetical protein
MIIMLDDWSQLKQMYLDAIDNDPTIPLDEQSRRVTFKGRVYWRTVSFWKDGKSTGEYIRCCDTCEEEIPF